MELATGPPRAVPLDELAFAKVLVLVGAWVPVLLDDFGVNTRVLGLIASGGTLHGRGARKLSWRQLKTRRPTRAKYPRRRVTRVQLAEDPPDCWPNVPGQANRPPTTCDAEERVCFRTATLQHECHAQVVHQHQLPLVRTRSGPGVSLKAHQRNPRLQHVDHLVVPPTTLTGNLPDAAADELLRNLREVGPPHPAARRLLVAEGSLLPLAEEVRELLLPQVVVLPGYVGVGVGSCITSAPTVTTPLKNPAVASHLFLRDASRHRSIADLRGVRRDHVLAPPYTPTAPEHR